MLYLSLAVMTSSGECTQGFTRRLQPLTMCDYDVDCDGLADLRDDAQGPLSASAATSSGALGSTSSLPGRTHRLGRSPTG